MSIVIVGGTTEGRRLAEALVADGYDVWTSLAGATARPAALPGRVRVGGFGSDAGMVAWLQEVGAEAIVDATHPFAAQMTQRMARLEAEGLCCVRLDRPGWSGRADAKSWTWVDSHEAACAAALAWSERAPGGESVLLTVGRQEVGRYAGLAESGSDGTRRRVVARMVTLPQDPVGCEVVLDRGPFTVASEREFMAAHDVGLLVTKDAGGPAAKLDVAAERGCGVIMLARPPAPPGLATVTDVAQARAWVARVTGGGGPQW